jgi:hypothetical protein
VQVAIRNYAFHPSAAEKGSLLRWKIQDFYGATGLPKKPSKPSGAGYDLNRQREALENSQVARPSFARSAGCKELASGSWTEC